MASKVDSGTSQYVISEDVNRRRLSPTRNLIAGSIGGITMVFAGQPFDTIKVRLQAASGAASTGPRDILVRTLRVEGLRGLYKGMLSPLLMATPNTAAAFYCLSLGKQLQLSDPTKEPTLLQYFKAGVFCGACVAFFIAPTDRLKCLLQVQNVSGGAAKYKGPYDCLVKVYKEAGVRGMFRGLGPTLGREMGGFGFWYITYEGLLRAMRRPDSTRDHAKPMAILLAGGSAGLAFWCITYPLDVVKTRVQVSPQETYPRGGRDAFLDIVRNEGARALYRGYVPCMMRAMVAHVALLGGYELTMKAMNLIVP